MTTAASQPRDVPTTSRRQTTFLWIVFGAACIQAVACVVVGLGNARAERGLGDLRRRGIEYAAFREGIYPNPLLAAAAADRTVPYTVYPPYALPMFAVFFEPGGLAQAALLVEALSIGALVVIGVQGRRWLRFAGDPWAALAAVCAAAVAGNATAYQLGQFSILCTGLIVLQLACLERGRPVAAGVCWTLAMLKPQIAAAFAVLFLFGRHWSGLVAGLASLAGLTLFACRWTDVTVERVVHHWMFGLPLYFTAHTQGLGPGPLAAWLGIDPRVVIAVGFVVLLVSMATLLWLLGRRRERIDPLSLAGVAGVFGELCLYHYHYDNVMLAPTLLGLLRLVASRPSPGAILITVLVMGTLYLPHRFMVCIPASGLLRGVIWAAAAALLLADGVARGRAPRGGEPAAPIDDSAVRSVSAAGTIHP